MIAASTLLKYPRLLTFSPGARLTIGRTCITPPHSRLWRCRWLRQWVHLPEDHAPKPMVQELSRSLIWASPLDLNVSVIGTSICSNQKIPPPPGFRPVIFTLGSVSGPSRTSRRLRTGSPTYCAFLLPRACQRHPIATLPRVLAPSQCRPLRPTDKIPVPVGRPRARPRPAMGEVFASHTFRPL